MKRIYNMKSLFVLALSLIFVLSQISFTVLADVDSDITVEYNAIEKCIVVSGNGEAPANSPVTVNVVSADAGVPSDENTPVISGMFFASEDGRLDFKLYISDTFPAGKYSVYIGMLNLDIAYSDTVMVFDKNSQETADVLEIINDCKSVSEITTAVTEGAGALGIDKDTVSDMDEVCKVIYGILRSEGDFDYEGFDRAFKTGLASVALSDGESPDSVMSKYASVFGTDYDTYSALRVDVKNVFDSLLLKIDFEKGYTDFGDVELMAELISADNVDTFKNLILDNEEFFGIDTEGDYEDLSANNRTKVFKAIFADRKDFVSPSDVADAFEKAVEDITDEVENKKESGSGSGKGSSGGGGGSYSVSTPVSPDLTPDFPQVTVAKYQDTNGHFSKDAVNKLSDMGIINGFEDGTFRPDDCVTRAQLAKMTVNALELSAGVNSKSFNDVSVGDWHYECINILSSNDIVTGDGISFYPDSLITRQDAAVILFRALGAVGKKINGSSEFADFASISDYAKEAVGAMASNGIIKGDSQGFRPHSSLTRGEAAVLINRIIEAL